MSIEETYDWAKKVSEDFQVMAERAEDVGALNKELVGGGDHQVATVSFAQFSAPCFQAEVGKVDDDLFFHFFPAENEYHSVIAGEGENTYWSFKEGFEDKMGDAFLAVFKHEDKLCWDFVPELHSWVVRCTGFGANVMANQLAEKLFSKLQRILET